MFNVTVIFSLIYLLSAVNFFRVWYSALQKDTDLTDRNRLLGLGILSVTTICWPIVVPISYLELLKAHRSQAGARDILQLEQLKQQLLIQKAQIEHLEQQLIHAQSIHPLAQTKVSTAACQMGTLKPGERNFSLIS